MCLLLCDAFLPPFSPFKGRFSTYQLLKYRRLIKNKNCFTCIEHVRITIILKSYCDKAWGPQALCSQHLFLFVYLNMLCIVFSLEYGKNKNLSHTHAYMRALSHPCKERHVCVSISPASQLSPGRLSAEALTCSSPGSQQRYGNTDLFRAAESSNFECVKQTRFCVT